MQFQWWNLRLGLSGFSTVWLHESGVSNFNIGLMKLHIIPEDNKLKFKSKLLVLCYIFVQELHNKLDIIFNGSV